MARKRTTVFNPQTFLSKVGSGKTSLTPSKKQVLYSQGDAADAVFYIQGGKVKLTVVSQQGREAVIAILEQGSFFGESCLAGQTVRTATATALADSSLVHIDKEMFGTTRSRVSFFMNKFRKLGFIEYNGGLHVHSSLINIVLHD